jgi:hypothetical protein
MMGKLKVTAPMIFFSYNQLRKASILPYTIANGKRNNRNDLR